MAGGMTNASGGGIRIKSIQRGVTNFDGTVLTVSTTLTTPVILANSIVRIIALAGGSDTASTSTANIEFENASTVKMTKSSAINQLLVYWEVIEFENVKSKQSGKTFTGNGLTVTINSVDVNKSLVFSSLRNDANFGGSVRADSGFVLTSPTQLTFRTSYSSGNTEATWQVIEFN
jgi:hypothetical protein